MDGSRTARRGMGDETGLKRDFEAAFYAPSTRGWNSAQGRSYWSGLEGWRDSIAGPLYSVVEKGGCEYVYTRDDRYFAGVNDPESLKGRLLEWHAKLAARVEHFAPASEAEQTDLAFMRSLVANMRSLIDRAIEIESRRWANR